MNHRVLSPRQITAAARPIAAALPTPSGKPRPIVQDTASADSEDLRIRNIAQSRLTKDGARAELPASRAEAEAILARLDAMERDHDAH